jgi:pyruvate/2-oxoglutarate dehydrogenase complex dihydrolipoamide dehydrogenase (E3) component
MSADGSSEPPIDVDVVVLGLGPGGETAAADLADAGLRVVGIDERLVGGECPYFGCTPSKMMVRAADLLAEAGRVAGMAGRSVVEADWTPVAERIAAEATHDWDDHEAVESLVSRGVTFVRGHGRLSGPRTVTVGGQSFTAGRGVVIATGTRPAVPPIDGLDQTPYWTNRDLVTVKDMPGSIIVIGGGAIGAELCQVFARFGVEVTLLEVADRILAQNEPEASALMTRVFAHEGIQVLAGQTIERIEYADGHFHAVLEATADSDTHTVRAEKLLVVTGRTNNLGDIGLESVGLDPDASRLEVDERLKVIEGLWAIGDVTGKGAYTHMANYQAGIVTDAILHGAAGASADYRAVPNVTYTDPEVGSVGMTQRQAEDAGLVVRVGHADLAESPRGWLHKRGNAGFVKVVEDADRQILVGATVAGPMGGELLGLLTLAVHAKVPTAALESMIYAFPTFHETIKTAVADLAPTA